MGKDLGLETHSQSHGHQAAQSIEESRDESVLNQRQANESNTATTSISSTSTFEDPKSLIVPIKREEEDEAIIADLAIRTSQPPFNEYKNTHSLAPGNVSQIVPTAISNEQTFSESKS